MRRQWSVEAIVEELRRLERTGVRMTMTTLIYNGHTGLASAIHNYIGGIARARRLAGIPEPVPLQFERESWDEDTVVATIRARHRAGESVAYRSVPTKLADAAVYHCGTWKNAIELAGLDYAKVRRSSPAWSRAEIVAALRAGARSGKTGTGAKGPVSNAVWLAARREFGSARKALAAAGLDPDKILRTRRLDDRELARAVRRLVREDPATSEGQLRSLPLGRVVVRRFGTLERGLRRLGIRWRPKRKRRRALRRS